MIPSLQHIFSTHPELLEQMEVRLQRNAQQNPNRASNPVQSIEELYPWLEHFLVSLPWDGLYLPHKSVFRRIDQSIGYVYFLFGDLQYEPEIVQWLKAYNTAWGEWLSRPESWSNECYELARTDSRFELGTEKYEAPENWHSWNEFFYRRLASGTVFIGKTIAEGIVTPSEGDLLEAPIKTMGEYAWEDLLGDSPYRERLSEAHALHLALDMYHYHRFHSPVEGKIVDIRKIEGIHTDGGLIIWDASQDRYRYAYSNNTDFQALETRGVVVIERPDGRLVGMVTVGVAQVSSVNWSGDIGMGVSVNIGQELGYFACGGSDIVLLYEE